MTPISPEKMAIYRQTARRRQEEAAQQLQERFQRAWDAARQAASVLKEEFGATRVAVFGSLVHPSLFHARSDIDLAVWGTAEMAYLRAWSRICEVTSEFGFDLIRVEEAMPRMLETIEKEGQLL